LSSGRDPGFGTTFDVSPQSLRCAVFDGLAAATDTAGGVTPRAKKAAGAVRRIRRRSRMFRAFVHLASILILMREFQ
jgi:hypothetical protein